VPTIQSTDVTPLALGALGLALISYNSAMVTARGFALKNRYDIDSNQEFIALGVADIGAGLLQGFAISGADSRTAVNDSVGGKSQLTGVVAAALLIAVLLFFTGPLAFLPVTVLAAVLINSAIGLFDLRGLLWLRRVSPQEFRLSIVTLLGVITTHARVEVALAEVKGPVRAMLERTGLSEQIGAGRMFSTIESAVAEIMIHERESVPKKGMAT